MTSELRHGAGDVTPRVRSDGLHPASRRWLCGGTVAALLIMHAWQTVRLFPSWPALVNNEPVISVDHAIHLYHGYLGAKFLAEHGTSWGYDPFFMAGYPKTPVYDSSSGPAELFQLLAGGKYSPRAYKIGVAVVVWLGLACVGTAAWAYGTGPVPTVVTMGLALWYWWIGFPDNLLRTGLVAFVWASAVAVLLPGVLLWFGRRPGAAAWAALAGAAALGAQAHVTLPLMAFVPVGVAYVTLAARGVDESGRMRTWRWHVAVWAALATALALTSLWWRPLLRFLPLKTSSEHFMRATYWNFFLEYYEGWDSRLPLLILLFGVVGLVGWWRSGRRLESAVLASQIGFLSLLTFAGSLWSTSRNLEPLRFQVPLCLAWCVAAGQGVCSVVSGLDPQAWAGSRWAKLGCASCAGSVVLAIMVTTPSTWWWALTRVVVRRWDRNRDTVLSREELPAAWRSRFDDLDANHDGRLDRHELLQALDGECPRSTWEHTLLHLRNTRRLAVGLRPEMIALVAWIDENTDHSARILFEDQRRLWEDTEPESMHWTPLLPLLTGREFIGGLYHLAIIPHRRAAFGDWHLGGEGDRTIRDWSPDELRAFCELYNVGWVITWSRASPLKDGGRPLSTDVFAALPFCERVAIVPRYSGRRDENLYSIFRMHREPSFFARGRGRVTRVDYNRLELADLEPESGRIVLRYHWQDGFRSEPPLRIERTAGPDDPVGFIGIATDRPVPRLVIENAYR